MKKLIWNKGSLSLVLKTGCTDQCKIKVHIFSFCVHGCTNFYKHLFGRTIFALLFFPLPPKSILLELECILRCTHSQTVQTAVQTVLRAARVGWCFQSMRSSWLKAHECIHIKSIWSTRTNATAQLTSHDPCCTQDWLCMKLIYLSSSSKQSGCPHNI